MNDSTTTSSNITLCICTMNRPDDLRTCLSSVLAGSCAPDQVIVSDDTPGDGPSQSAQLVASEFPRVDYLVGPRRGLGPNRNACIRQAKSDWIMFIDDDVQLPTDFIANAKAVIKATHAPKMIYSGYELKNGEKVTPHNIDFLGFMHVPIKHQDYRSIVINATLFPRSLFKRASFDEQLRYGCEEMDMAHHAVAEGYTISYRDELFVYHNPSQVNRDGYKKFADASRLYITTKVYWQYEKLPLKAVAYALVAPLHLMAAAAKRRNAAAVRSSCGSIALAFRYLTSHFARKRQTA